jgi:hypothetical protein
MQYSKAKQEEVKFTVDYLENGKLEARWHYNHEITKAGPILVEHFNLPREVSKSKKPKSKGHASVQSLSKGDTREEG